MAVKRIEQLDIKNRGFITAIVGNTDDVFIDKDLCRYNLETQLYLYLKSVGYDYIYFYSRESGVQLNTYDGIEALRWLFPGDESQTSNVEGAVSDGRPLGRRSRYRRNTSCTELINSAKRMGRTYYYSQSLRDTALIDAILYILNSKDHKSVICFTSTALHISNEGFIPALIRLKRDMAASHSPNRMLIIYEGDEDALLNNLSHPRSQDIFYNSFFIEQFRKGNSLNHENVFVIDVPDKEECGNWINYMRIVEKRFNNDEIFSFPYKKLIEQIFRQKKQLDYLEKDAKEPHFIESLRVVEFSEELLANSLNKIHGQQDNMPVIIDKVVAWVNKPIIKRPLVLMFAGPSGTGKTYTAKTVAEALKSLGFVYEKLNMNEYQNEADSWKLLGSSTGYSGSTGDSPLFAARKKSEKLVILFDEIEKAHSNLFTAIMGLMDEGMMANGRGEKYDFSQSIIVFTTNLAMDKLAQKKAELRTAGVETVSYKFQQETKQILKDAGLRNEICGRIQCLLVYNELNEETVARIAIEEIRNLANDFNLRVNNIPESLLREVLQIAHSNEGARPIKDYVSNRLTKKFGEYLKIIEKR